MKEAPKYIVELLAEFRVALESAADFSGSTVKEWVAAVVRRKRKGESRIAAVCRQLAIDVRAIRKTSDEPDDWIVGVDPGSQDVAVVSVVTLRSGERVPLTAEDVADDQRWNLQDPEHGQASLFGGAK